MRSDNVAPWRPSRAVSWPRLDDQIRRMADDSRWPAEPIEHQQQLTSTEVRAAIELARRDPRRKMPGWRSPLATVIAGLLRDARNGGPIGQVARRAVRLMVERNGADEEEGK